jgi:magnesium-transporting ATPase (P-type)
MARRNALVKDFIPYLAYVPLGIPLPLTILQILAVDPGTDMLPALALGADPPDPGIMKQKPRPRRERLLNRFMLTASLPLMVWLAAVPFAALLFTAEEIRKYYVRRGLRST